MSEVDLIEEPFSLAGNDEKNCDTVRWGIALDSDNMWHPIVGFGRSSEGDGHELRSVAFIPDGSIDSFIANLLDMRAEARRRNEEEFSG